MKSFLFISLLSAVTMQAQSGGEAAARKLIADYAAAENRHDIAGMVALFRSDALFRTVQGYLSKGTTQIQRTIAEAYGGVFSKSHAVFEITDIAVIKPDVVMVDTIMERIGVQTPDGRPIPGQRKSLANFILTKEGDGWRIASYRNNVPVSFTPGGPTVLDGQPGREAERKQ